MGEAQPKVWGTTETLIDHPTNSTHRIFVQPGGYCSMHFHEHKWNAFVVLKGMLTIVLTDGTGGNFDVAYLYPGDVFKVAPGQRHRFLNESGSTVEALEYYWPEGDTKLGEDIVRFDEGGLRK
jgi:mannose-6-phosphate isomerase-like protein (cupin superfamily)